MTIRAPQRLLGREASGATSARTISTKSARSSSATRSSPFEMFKKGDLDFYSVNIAREWVEELASFDKVERGLIQKRKIFNDNPHRTLRARLQHAQAAVRRRPVRKALAPPAQPSADDREALLQRVYADRTRTTPGSALREPETIRRCEYDPQRGADAARRGRLEGSRRAGTTDQERPAADDRAALRRQDVRAGADDLPGRPAQGRHQPEPPARDARDAVSADRSAEVRSGA